MAVLELEAPASTEQKPTALHQDPPAAVAAAELLDAGDEGDAVEEVEVESEEGNQEADAAPELTTMVAEPVPNADPLMPMQPQLTDACRRRADYMRRKDILQERICALEIEQSKLKEQAKLCKKESEVLLEQLNQLIESYENPPAPAAATDTAAGKTADGCGAQPADQPAETAITEQTEPASPSGVPCIGSRWWIDWRGGYATVTGIPDGTGIDFTMDNGLKSSICLNEWKDAVSKQDVRAEISHVEEKIEAARTVQKEAKTEAAYRAALEAATVAELDIGAKVREKLIEAGAATLWSLEQLRGDISQGKAKWPKGIGEAKITGIEDAILKWMAAHSSCWDQVQGENDRIEAAADSERAAEVAESQPPQPTAEQPAVSLDDL